MAHQSNFRSLCGRSSGAPLILSSTSRSVPRKEVPDRPGAPCGRAARCQRPVLGAGRKAVAPPCCGGLKPTTGWGEKQRSTVARRVPAPASSCEFLQGGGSIYMHGHGRRQFHTISS